MGHSSKTTHGICVTERERERERAIPSSSLGACADTSKGIPPKVTSVITVTKEGWLDGWRHSLAVVWCCVVVVASHRSLQYVTGCPIMISVYEIGADGLSHASTMDSISAVFSDHTTTTTTTIL